MNRESVSLPEIPSQVRNLLTGPLELLKYAEPIRDLPMAGQTILTVKRIDRRPRHADHFAGCREIR